MKGKERQMKKWDVFVFGDINVDLLVPDISGFPPAGEEWEVPTMETAPGGGAALFALGLARLGLKPVFLGSVGDDFYGEYLKKYMEETGVDILFWMYSQKPKREYPSALRTSRTGPSSLSGAAVECLISGRFPWNGYLRPSIFILPVIRSR